MKMVNMRFTIDTEILSDCQHSYVLITHIT